VALSIYEEIDTSSGGDDADEGLIKCKNNWASIDTEIYNARGGEASLDARLDKFFPPGTQMWFFEDAAPSGWTINTGVADCLIAIKGGANAYNTTGGTNTEVGTWTQPNHIHTMPSHTHTLVHTHTGPSHTHQWFDANSGNTGFTLDFGGNDRTWDSDGSTQHSVKLLEDHYTILGGTGNTGAASGATTSSVDPGDTANSATAATYRPYAAIGIVAAKD